jgi:hypothetical protein
MKTLKLMGSGGALAMGLGATPVAAWTSCELPTGGPVPGKEGRRMWTRITRNFGRKVLSVGFFLNGFVLMGLALTMVWMFGEGLGATWFEQRVYGSAHVCLHLFGTLSAFAISTFLKDKAWGFTVVAALAVIAMGGYGIINMIGFASKNRGGVAMAAEEYSKRAMAKYHDDREYLQGQIKWLEGQSLDYDNTPKARKDYKAEAAKAKATLDALEPPKVSTQTIDPDSLANLLSRVTTLTSSEASQVLAIPLSVLLYISEVLSFIFGLRIWPRKPDEVVGQDAMTKEAMIAGLSTPKDRGLTVPEIVPADLPTGLATAGMVPADLPTGLAAAGMVPAGEAMIAGLPTRKDRCLTVPADLPTGLAAAGMVPAAEAMIAGLPMPKDRCLTVPADLPTGLAAAGMVPAAVLLSDVPQEKALPVEMPPKLRNAHPAEHMGVVLAALRSRPQGALAGDPLPVSVADGADPHPADGHEHVLQAPRRSVRTQPSARRQNRGRCEQNPRQGGRIHASMRPHGRGWQKAAARRCRQNCPRAFPAAVTGTT